MSQYMAAAAAVGTIKPANSTGQPQFEKAMNHPPF